MVLEVKSLGRGCKIAKLLGGRRFADHTQSIGFSLASFCALVTKRIHWDERLLQGSFCFVSFFLAKGICELFFF